METEDPAQFFTMIFGGEAFVDLIGEISLMKDLTTTMDITMQQMEEEELAASAEEKLNLHDQETHGETPAAPSTAAEPACRTQTSPLLPVPPAGSPASRCRSGRE